MGVEVTAKTERLFGIELIEKIRQLLGRGMLQSRFSEDVSLANLSNILELN